MRGLNVTVLCGLGGLGLEGVGGGKSGDVSVEAEAIAGIVPDTGLSVHYTRLRSPLAS